LIPSKIISSNQNGFVRERKIKNCICIISKVINMLSEKVKGGNVAFKWTLRNLLILVLLAEHFNSSSLIV